MSTFELITLTLSFVIGLSMSHLLWSAASAIRMRRQLQLHWLPFTWAFSIFFAHVQYWFAIMSIDQQLINWTWATYLSTLTLGVLLFFSGALIFPSEAQQRSGSLIEDFQEHGKLGLVPLGAYFLFWVPISRMYFGAWTSWGNAANLALFLIASASFLLRNEVSRGVLAVLFAALEIWAIVAIWGGPTGFQ